MNTSFDQTRPQNSFWDEEGIDFVRSNMDWCTRCSRRMVGLNPALSAEQALDLALELSMDEQLRQMSPETVAEDLHGTAPPLED